MEQVIGKDQFQQALGLLSARASKLNGESKVSNGDTIGRFVAQLEDQLKLPNPEQVKVIEELRAQVLELQEASKAPNPQLEEAQIEIARLIEVAEETGLAHEKIVLDLRAQLEKALEEDPRIAELTEQLEKALQENLRIAQLTEQIKELETARERTALEHQQAIELLEGQVQKLTLAAENHPREIEELTERADGEARKVELLQQSVKVYQDVAIEVARLPHNQAATQLEVVQKQLEAVVGETAEAKTQRALLNFKIGLLQAKQEEHEAIQKKLQEAHRSGSQEVLNSPEVLLEKQVEFFRKLQETMEENFNLLKTPVQNIPQKIDEVTELHRGAVEERQKLGNVEDQGPEKQLQALRLDQTVTFYDNQLRMLTALQEGFEAFGKVNQGLAGATLMDLHQQVTETLGQERLALQQLEEANEDQPAIALQAEKVRGLEQQAESLQGAIKQYQEHSAMQVIHDAQFLHTLIALVPQQSRGEVTEYLRNAVRAIAAMQETLIGYGPEQVAHTGIQKLLNNICRWRGEYMGIIREVINSTGHFGGIDFHEAKVQLAGFVEQLVRKQAELQRLIALSQAQIADELEQARADLQLARDQHNQANEGFHGLRVQILETIQTQHHLPLEKKMGVIGTMQRLFFGFFNMIFSISGVLLGGLQTVGSPLVSRSGNN